MEDLQSLMSCLDEISNVIGDGMYLNMADKLKNIHNKLNGDRPFHEDSFYYSDEDDDDSDYETEHTRIESIRRELLEYVKCMHAEWRNVENWTKVVESISPIKRMSTERKNRAIMKFCHDFSVSAYVAPILVGYEDWTTIDLRIWTWKNLKEHGLHTLVSQVGTEEEIKIVKERGTIYEDEVSLATMRRINTFEKTIYDEFKESENKKIFDHRDKAIENVRLHEERMTQYERHAQEEENKLREYGAVVYGRDYWNPETRDFFVNNDGKMVDDGYGIRGTFERR